MASNIGKMIKDNPQAHALAEDLQAAFVQVSCILRYLSYVIVSCVQSTAALTTQGLADTAIRAEHVYMCVLNISALGVQP